MSGLISTLAIVWRIAIQLLSLRRPLGGTRAARRCDPDRTEHRRITVLLNQWNNRFYNALQERNWDAFVSELLFFCGLATAFIILAVINSILISGSRFAGAGL